MIEGELFYFDAIKNIVLKSKSFWRFIIKLFEKRFQKIFLNYKEEIEKQQLMYEIIIQTAQQLIRNNNTDSSTTYTK